MALGPELIKIPQNRNHYQKYTSLLLELRHARHNLEPKYTNDTTCAIMVGSPGTTNMEYVSVPCDTKLQVAGTMCVDRGQERRPNSGRVVYELSHVMLEPKSYFTFTDEEKAFNLKRLDPTVFNESNTEDVYLMPPTDNLGRLIIHETRTAAQQVKLRETTSQQFQWAWIDKTKTCNQNPSLTDMRITLGNNSGCLDHICSVFTDCVASLGLRTLTKHVIIVESTNLTTSNTSLIHQNNELTAFGQCAKDWLPFSGECVKVFANSEPQIGGISATCRSQTVQSNVFTRAPDRIHNEMSNLLKRCHLTDTSILVMDTDGNCLSFVFKDETVTHVYCNNNIVVPYIVCSTEAVQAVCPAGYNLCDSECVNQLLWCDGSSDCTDGADEAICNDTCHALFHTNLTYCLNSCHPDNCSCDELYFQCRTGGCINSGRLCDGIQDCRDKSDEQICPDHYAVSFNKVNIPVIQSNTIDDLYPDVEDASDEQTYIDLLKSHLVSSSGTRHCRTTTEMPCLPGHPACYSIEKRCMYDHTAEGHLKYCRNGLHLLGCEHVDCSRSYKCRHSYCVPAHKVCDGVFDCPYRDDESECPIITCGNMLHCGDRCVHPDEVCDGTKHCQSGIDELLCGAPSCPNGCHCMGYSVKCIGPTAKEVHFILTGNIKMLKITHDKFTLKSTVFDNVAFTLFLDLSQNRISKLPVPSMFHTLNTVIRLNLSSNDIHFFEDNSFLGLKQLREIDLSGNPVLELRRNAFVGLTNLRVLLLHSSYLRFVSSFAFANVSNMTLNLSRTQLSNVNSICLLNVSVAILDLRGTTLSSSRGTKGCWSRVTAVLTNQQGVCCLTAFRGKCLSKSDSLSECVSLFNSEIFQVYTYAIVILIALTNTATVFYNFHLSGTVPAVVLNLALSNSLLVIPLYKITEWHSSFGRSVHFHEAFVGVDMWCSFTGGTLILSTQVGTTLMLAVSALKCYGVFTIGREGLLQKRVHSWMGLAFIWLSWIGFTSVFLVVNQLQSTTELSYCLLGHKHNTVNQVLLALFAVVNVTCSVLVGYFYYRILVATINSARISGGHKHGGNSLHSVVIRLLLSMMISIIAALGPGLVFLLWISDLEFPSRSVVKIVIVVVSLQSISNPCVHTLCTRRFIARGREFVGFKT